MEADHGRVAHSHPVNRHARRRVAGCVPSTWHGRRGGKTATDSLAPYLQPGTTSPSRFQAQLSPTQAGPPVGFTPPASGAGDTGFKFNQQPEEAETQTTIRCADSRAGCVRCACCLPVSETAASADIATSRAGEWCKRRLRAGAGLRATGPGVGPDPAAEETHGAYRA
jgi:hypothetical protein